MSRRGLAVVLGLVGCADDSGVSVPDQELPPAVFEEVCGTEGPHRLLALETGEHAYRVDRVSGEERVMVSTFLVDPQVPLASLPPTLDLVIHAVGDCGEQPVELARGLTLTSGHQGLLLACREGGHGAHVLDPSGQSEPRPILDGWCPLRSTDAGLLTVEAAPDERHGALVLLREPADPDAIPQVLAQGIRTGRNTYFGPGSGASTSLWARGTEAVALGEDGVVHRFDLVTAESTKELAGVRELRVSSDGRWMIWQALEPVEGDPETPVGPVFLRDREARTDEFLLGTHLEWTGNPYAGEYLVIRDDAQGLRMFRWPQIELVELPAGTDYRGVLGDHELWLARRVDGITEELRWIPGAEPVVFARHDGVVSRRGDGVEIFETDDAPDPNEGSLTFVPYEGGDPVRLADHVHTSRGRLADGRILTVVNQDDSEHGSLRLIDPDAGAWVQLDPRGYMQSPRLGRSDPFDGDVVFAAAEPGPDGRGVYRARVPR